ncbi:MAG: YraN family protein [Candidatus Uhrbacteria bacterium]|nr:YraN family protein [Candidatus Uhrbacteria bacterium]MDP3793264.1 YraN family protein [Candidatus Uhrbacteria bacterium]
MPDPRKLTGSRGEELAAVFLQTKGFRIITKNWTCRLGEIDVIAERDGEVRFVEVKTRYSMTYGYPEEAITRTKRRHLAHAIELWLRTVSSPPLKYQADAIAILIEPGKKPQIEWIEGIL